MSIISRICCCKMRKITGGVVIATLCAGASLVLAVEPTDNVKDGEYSQWCGRTDRNRVAQATGLADSFEEFNKANATAPLRNVKWTMPLGEYVYGSPVVAGGKVYIGGRRRGNGVFWCFRESDGTLLWQLQSPYIKNVTDLTWGITSTPTVEGDRVYLLGQMGEVLCLNANGLANGNTGPFQEEAAWLALDRQVIKNEINSDDQRVVEYSDGTPGKLEKNDADIIWRFDMIKNARCWPYNAGNAAILIRGDYLYVPTCSTRCQTKESQQQPLREWEKAHPNQGYPSPNLIVLDKNTGALLAVDETGAFGRSCHGAHSSPALGVVNGKELIVWGSGDGMCYGIDPNFTPGVNGQPGVLKTVWEFDCVKNLIDPKTGKPFGKRIKKEILATPVIDHNRVYVAVGTDLIESGERARDGRLVCFDATKTGDITDTGCIWKFDDLRSCGATVAIADELLYTADASGMVYCLDAQTGKMYWSHKTRDVWASPLVADGKVFVATKGKGLLVFATGKEKQIISEAVSTADMVASPAVANGVLYFADQHRLYAVQPSSK